MVIEDEPPYYDLDVDEVEYVNPLWQLAITIAPRKDFEHYVWITFIGCAYFFLIHTIIHYMCVTCN